MDHFPAMKMGKLNLHITTDNVEWKTTKRRHVVWFCFIKFKSRQMWSVWFRDMLLSGKIVKQSHKVITLKAMAWLPLREREWVAFGCEGHLGCG